MPLIEENKDLLMTLDLQYFADGEEGVEGQEDQSQQQQQQEDPQPPAKDGEGEKKEEKPAGTFTQEDVNAIASREAKKAQEKLLKQLGVSDFNSAKDGLAKFKEWQDSQKSDQEKLNEEFQSAQEELNKLREENFMKDAKLSAISSGINPENVDDVIVLAKAMVNDDTTIDEAIQKVSEKYPHFKLQAQQEQEQEKEKKPKFLTGEHGKGEKETELDKWRNAFKF